MPGRLTLAAVIGCILGLGPFVVAWVLRAGAAPAWFHARNESLLIPGFLVALVLPPDAGRRVVEVAVAIGSLAFWTASTYLIVSLGLLWTRGRRRA
ncbi:MAG TPA: hypothetical protein VGG73_16485 [Vicinamibacterales bacterium]|jgi:hypothetical protein